MSRINILILGAVMKNIGTILAILLLAITATIGQQTSNGGSDAAAKPAGNGATAIERAGKVVVPEEKSRAIVIPKAASAPVIDGRVDEEVWKNAAVFKDFYQTNPGYNTEASKPTIAYLMYDEYNLYVAFKCWDERDKIRATVAKRDQVFGEDNVRIWLDTYFDRRRAYVIGFNPLGIQQDGIFTEGQGGDFSVDIVMESKGVIEDWGWSVEAKIPFKSLRYKSGKGVVWGFNVARNIDRLNDEFDQWLPDDRDVSGFLIKHGKITGLDDIKYERTLEIVPSVTLRQTGRNTRTIPRYALTPASVDPGRFVNEPVTPEIGVTLKYTLTPSITLDAAINPDFAEIEADAPVVTANQRFPIFFEEKRPFFLEGVEIFRSPLQVFYSRNIIDPDAAVKLSGKVGKTSFGLLAASDNAPGNYDEDDRNDRLIRPRIDEFLDKNSLFGVVRIKRDFGKENNIGFFGTYRAFPEQKNLLAGFDGRLKFSPKMESQFQVVGTASKRCFFDPEFEPTLNPIQTASNRQICGGGSYGGVTVPGSTFSRYRVGNGLGYYFNLDYSEDTKGWFLEMGGRSSFYRADAGFTRRTNSNFAFFYHRNSTKSKPKARVIRANWGKYVGIDYDWKGRIQGQNAGTNINLNLQGSSFLSFEVGSAYERLYEEEFGLKRSATRTGTFLGPGTRSTWQQYSSVNFFQNLNKHLNYNAFVGVIRNSFDFFFVDELTGRQNPGPGLQFDAGLGFELKPIDPLTISARYNKSRLSRNDNRVRSFDSDILSIRSTYQFTRFVFTRFRLDYDGTDKRYGGQLLFGWAPSPGTAFYVGYNDNLKRNGFSDFTGQFEPGFNRMSRTFFIRASYLFRRSF